MNRSSLEQKLFNEVQEGKISEVYRLASNAFKNLSSSQYFTMEIFDRKGSTIIGCLATLGKFLDSLDNATKGRASSEDLLKSLKDVMNQPFESIVVEQRSNFLYSRTNLRLFARVTEGVEGSNKFFKDFQYSETLKHCFGEIAEFLKKIQPIYYRLAEFDLSSSQNPNSEL
ncbi:MAG: hypothetical protein MHMPM18_002809 [Marteilia pararefringens]